MENADHCREAIRLACEKDLGAVMGIYDAARRFMRSTGNLTQWTGGYPSLAHAERDLKNGWLWVFDEGFGPIACMSVMPGPDRTYASIDGEQWLNDEPYWVMHRLACAEQGRGIGPAMLAFLCTEHDNVRADTHEDNAPMQRALERAGFKRRGTIVCDDRTPRIAFHYVAGVSEALG